MKQEFKEWSIAETNAVNRALGRSDAFTEMADRIREEIERSPLAQLERELRKKADNALYEREAKESG